MLRRDRSHPDYPFYDDEPASMSLLDWGLILAALAVSFAIFVGAPPVPWLSATMDGLLRSILFGAIPLSIFVWRAGPQWTAIFHGWRWRYLWWGLLFGVLNQLFTLVIGMFAIGRMHLVNNSVGEGLSHGVIPGGPAIFYVSTGIQLFGEELFTILPFLFLMWLGRSRLGLSRGGALLLGWIGSALIFGALHLPAYHGNIGQALLLIGPVRLVLTLAYMKTKSIWASTIAHVLNDWSMFTMLMVVGSGSN